MKDTWEVMAYLLTQDKVWGLQNYIRDDDGQIDVCIQIPGPLEILKEYKDIVGGFIARTNNPDLEYDGGLALILRNEELDAALHILYEMIKIIPHGLSSKITKATRIRERVREGNSYPFYDPRSAKRG